jgi:hypothetical protein
MLPSPPSLQDMSLPDGYDLWFMHITFFWEGKMTRLSFLISITDLRFKDSSVKQLFTCQITEKTYYNEEKKQRNITPPDILARKRRNWNHGEKCVFLDRPVK